MKTLDFSMYMFVTASYSNYK